MLESRFQAQNFALPNVLTSFQVSQLLSGLTNIAFLVTSSRWDFFFSLCPIISHLSLSNKSLSMVFLLAEEVTVVAILEWRAVKHVLFHFCLYFYFLVFLFLFSFLFLSPSFLFLSFYINNCLQMTTARRRQQKKEAQPLLQLTS